MKRLRAPCSKCGYDGCCSYCPQCEPKASAEAEALRKGIESLLAEFPEAEQAYLPDEVGKTLGAYASMRSKLQNLLDKTDAGELLAHLEKPPKKRRARRL